MKQKNTPAKIRCPYCGRSAVLRKASYVYKEKALDEYLYVCAGYPECDAYVGVHAGTMRPKGTLANGDLRHQMLSTAELIGCTENGKRRLKNNDELMKCLYHDETTDCDSIVTDCRVSETRFPVLTAVANLYFKQQITFQIL